LVDLALLQSVSYIAGALGVCVAAGYYVMNLRIGERNRKTQLSMNLAEKLNSKEFLQNMMDVLSLKWNNVDDYLKKYDSTVNPESYVLRNHVWFTFDSLGGLMREGLVDSGIVFNAAGGNCISVWGMYKPVFDYYRRVEFGPRWLENFEYLAKEMYKLGRAHGYLSPDHVRADGSKVDLYPDVFK
jgi:hypothetical protein